MLAACRLCGMLLKRDYRITALGDQGKFGGKLTTDQGRIYRTDRGTTFYLCKTVSLGNVRSRDGDQVALANTGWASSSRHGHDARNDSAAPIRKQTSIPTFTFVDGGQNAFQEAPADGARRAE
jgi:hypothetical protein